ncbi:MAG: MerR family transcriptional regulator [Nitrospirota bacterium]
MHDAYESPQTLRLFPEKLFYKIGEVSRLVGVESYVLRYWETEFSFLKPRKSKSGQRVYTRADIDLVLQIKKLLYEEKYTIDGVRRKFGAAAEPPHTTLSLVADAAAETVESPAEQDAGRRKEGSARSADTEEVLTLVKSRLKEILQHHFGA